jgi:hypothetical protein
LRSCRCVRDTRREDDARNINKPTTVGKRCLIHRTQHIALKDDASLLLKRSRSLDNLGRVKVLVFILRHRNVQIRQQSRDGHVVGGFVGRRKQIVDRRKDKVLTAKFELRQPSAWRKLK